MRPVLLLSFLVVVSAIAGGVREYRHGEWKSVITVHPRPEYPVEARHTGLQGEGYFRLYFGRDGRVTNVKILQSTGHYMLDDAAVAGFMQWHAKPGPRRELDTGIAYALSGWPLPPPVHLRETILREFSN
jgi:TonB family protein